MSWLAQNAGCVPTKGTFAFVGRRNRCGGILTPVSFRLMPGQLCRDYTEHMGRAPLLGCKSLANPLHRLCSTVSSTNVGCQIGSRYRNIHSEAGQPFLWQVVLPMGRISATPVANHRLSSGWDPLKGGGEKTKQLQRPPGRPLGCFF